MFKHAVLGGTFDHLHSGHGALLTEAFAIASRVTIGLTTDAYVRQYKCDENISGVACPCVSSSRIQSFATRKQQVETWLREHHFLNRADIVPIDDMYGPTVGKNTMDVIVVSTDTKEGAVMINKKRKAVRLPVLAVHTVWMVKAENTQPISSTRIRKQEIDTEGKLIMPDSMRSELAEPFGIVLKDGNTESIIRGDHDAIVIAVGDKTTKRLLDNGLVPTLAIVDMQVERLPYMWEKEYWNKLPKTKQEFKSGPGYISRDATNAIISWSKKKSPSVFVIDGEEDLLVLPVILYAPIKSIVYYGQPNVGMVRVAVTDKIKEKAAILLKRFY